MADNRPLKNLFKNIVEAERLNKNSSDDRIKSSQIGNVYLGTDERGDKVADLNRKILNESGGNIFIGDDRTYNFKYGLHLINKGGSPDSHKSTDEDPTILGFELRLNTFESPLFNNEIISFFNTYPNVAEVANRETLHTDFIDHLSLFVNNLTKTGNKNIKSHYIQKIAGLSNLVESVSDGENKQFIDFGKDLINITMYDDVSLNGGYLAYLYKTLSWSRINGKKVIPDNLLRFDCDIIISEVRNFKKVSKAVENGNYSVLRDNISRYVYKLYECQFIFNNLSHADAIDNSSSAKLDNFEFAIQYKYSTVRMEKFTINSNGGSDLKILNNSSINPNLQFSGEYRLDSENGGTLENIGQNTPEVEGDERNPLLAKLEKLGKNIANRIITDKFRLINRAIDKIRNQVGLKRIRAPHNVYDKDFGTIRGILRNEVQNFVGDAVNDALGTGRPDIGENIKLKDVFGKK